jgi:hypothetical protein
MIKQLEARTPTAFKNGYLYVELLETNGPAMVVSTNGVYERELLQNPSTREIVESLSDNPAEEQRNLEFNEAHPFTPGSYQCSSELTAKTMLLSMFAQVDYLQKSQFNDLVSAEALKKLEEAHAAIASITCRAMRSNAVVKTELGKSKFAYDE